MAHTNKNFWITAILVLPKSIKQRKTKVKRIFTSQNFTEELGKEGISLF